MEAIFVCKKVEIFIFTIFLAISNNNNIHFFYLFTRSNCYLQFVHPSIAKLIESGGIMVQ